MSQFAVQYKNEAKSHSDEQQEIAPYSLLSRQ